MRSRLVLLATVVAACLGPAASARAAAPPVLTPSAVGEAPNGPDVFRFPQAVAIDPGNGTVFVADEYSGRIQAFAPNGTFLLSFGMRAARHEPGRLGVIGGLAIDRAEHLYVLDSENDRVQIFSALDGHFISTFGSSAVFRLTSGGARSVEGIAAGGLTVYQAAPTSSPTVYVADNGNNRIEKFIIGLASMAPVAPPRMTTSGGFDQPQGIAVNPSGTRLFVADDRNHRIVVLARKTLREITAFGTQGNGPGEFEFPYDVAIDARAPSQLYVADNLNGRVNVFDAKTLQYTATFGGNGHRVGLFSIVRALAAPPGPNGGVAVADTANDRIQVLTPNGEVTAAWGLSGRGPGYFTRPRGAAFTPDGGIVVADTFDDRVARFAPDGTFVAEYGLVSPSTGHTVPGGKPGQFAGPYDVTIDTDGDTWVADTGNGRVSELDAAGNPIYSSDLDGLAGPQSISTGPSGSVYVADTGDGEVLQFAQDGGAPTTVRSGLNHPVAVAWDGQSKVYAATAASIIDAATGDKVAPPTDEEHWDHPDGLAVGPGGTLYVSERRLKVAGGGRVIRGTPDGTGGFTWDTIASEGSGDGQVIDPANLSVSPDGATLLVADVGNNRVLRFDAPGHGPAPMQALQVGVSGGTRGFVTSQPAGISCLTDCQQSYGTGRVVTLVETSVTGSMFSGWTGACAPAGTNRTCTITMTGPMAVGATFVALPPPPPRFTGLTLSPRHWHLARRARHHHHSRPATHARLAVRINVNSTVVLQVQVARPGKLMAGRCVAFHGRAPKSKQRCTRFATQRDSRTLHLLAGTTRFTLTPRVVKRTLKPGTYRLQLTATNAIGQTAMTFSRQFVVRP